MKLNTYVNTHSILTLPTKLNYSSSNITPASIKTQERHTLSLPWKTALVYMPCSQRMDKTHPTAVGEATEARVVRIAQLFWCMRSRIVSSIRRIHVGQESYIERMMIFVCGVEMHGCMGGQHSTVQDAQTLVGEWGERDGRCEEKLLLHLQSKWGIRVRFICSIEGVKERVGWVSSGVICVSIFLQRERHLREHQSKPGHVSVSQKGDDFRIFLVTSWRFTLGTWRPYQNERIEKFKVFNKSIWITPQ